jgi:hypothetical protein
MDRCSVCILPSSLPDVVLDNDKICNHCHSFRESRAQHPKEPAEARRKQLELILRKFRGRGAYDALVPVSGGKDSMFVLYLLAKEFGLNILAYNFDNGFQSERARLNIQAAVKKLGVELVVFKPSEQRLLDLYRTFLLRAGEFCSPCNMMIGAAAKRIARQNGIRLIALGGAAERNSGLDGMSMSHYTDRRYYLNVIQGRIAYDDIRFYINASPVVNTFKRYLGLVPVDIDVLDYVHPGTAAMKEILEREIGWQPPSAELEHGDCTLNPLKDYLMNRRWGFSEVTPAYAALVRIGEMTRDDALRHAEEAEVRSEPKVLDDFLARIGVTRAEFAATGERHFSEIPNYRASKVFNAVKSTLALFRRIVGTVR